MSIRVQFVVSEEEYEILKRMVSEKGVSISKYVKDAVFSTIPQKTSFESLWQEFTEKLDEYPCGIEFDVSQIMTQGRWNSLDRSAKLSIARLFNKKVSVEKSVEFSNIELVGRSSSNVSIYKKIRNN